MKKTLRLSAVLSFLLLFGITACNNFGKKINIAGTKGEVFYKGDATESDAQKLGDFLKQDGFFGNEKPASAQVTRQGEIYTIRFVYNKDYYEKTPGLEVFFEDYTRRMSKELFNNKRVDITLADKYFKDFRNIPFDETAAKTPAAPPEETFSKADYTHKTIGDVNFYWKDISDEESKPILNYISGNGAFSGGTAEIYISREDGRYILKFPVKDEYQKDEGTIAEVEKVAKEIKNHLFANEDYSFKMTDEKLNPIRSFDY